MVTAGRYDDLLAEAAIWPRSDGLDGAQMLDLARSLIPRLAAALRESEEERARRTSALERIEAMESRSKVGDAYRQIARDALARSRPTDRSEYAGTGGEQ